MGVVSMPLPRPAWLPGALVVLVGCGGGESTAAAPPDASAGDGAVAVSAVYRTLLPQVAGAGVITYTCLPGPLPVDDAGAPNCIVVSAQFLPEGDGAVVDQPPSCPPCEAGLEPFTSSIPLDTLGEGLAMYPCLCTVPALPPSAHCPQEDRGDDAGASWCYGGQGTDGFPPSAVCQSILGFYGPPSGALYVACFGLSTPLTGPGDGG
jgi:hypothetical protein